MLVLPILYCTLLLFRPITGSLLDSFQDSLSSLKSYTKDLLPYLSSALKALKRVDDFVESTIAEECVYTCPKKNFMPIPKPNHVGTSNGCGSFDLFIDEASSLISVEPEFIECCNQHDLCYDSCGSDKDECDFKFKKCLYNTCKSKKGWSDNKACKAKAKAAFVTVVGVGCQSFVEAQSEACVCVHKDVKGRDEL